VILTAGPEGFFSGGVSVDYSDALPSLSVIGFRSLRTPPYLMFHFGQTTDQPPYISNINAVSAPFARMGIGLPAGQSAYIGTVSFHTERTGPSLAKIAVATDGPDGTDDLGRLGDYANISATTTFNSAYVVRAVASRPCGPVEIEVNTLHTAGSKVQAGPDQSVDVTAKARIRKGTAPAGTILPTTLEIRAFDGSIPIGRNATPESAIELEVGKDGNGATLPVEVPRCTTGSIRFWATFTGLNLDRLICNGARTITRECK